jgi:hypothetical protein
MARQNIDFQLIWNEALRAAQVAAEAEAAKLGEDACSPDRAWPSPGDGCAFLEMPRSLPFAQWAATALDPIWEDDEADNPHPERLLLGDSQFSFACEDILSVHKAAARAACEVLTRSLQTSTITVVCVPD